MQMNYDTLVALGKKVLDGGSLNFSEALSLTEIDDADVPLLLGIANKVRATFTGDAVDTCEIINARSGNCSENCKFCAQSAHNETKIDAYPLLDEAQIIHAAKQAEANGAYRFCVVTAGCGTKNDPDFDRIVNTIKRIGEETDINRCCSLGVLEEEHVAALKAAGITRYHHNLETSASHFDAICTTHTYDERVATIKKIKAAGLQACSGGIIGMGETWQQRIELAFALKELDVDSIPMNVLNPIPGTPLENMERLRPLDILKSFAIFRLILPTKIIRYAGGREQSLGELVPLGLIAGINGMLIGNYLTTSGRGSQKDLQTIANLGLKPLA